MAVQQPPPATQPDPNLTITLQPLLDDGPDALDPAGIPGIAQIKLIEAEIAKDNKFHEGTTWKADDIYAAAAASGSTLHPRPEDGTLTRAATA